MLADPATVVLVDFLPKRRRNVFTRRLLFLGRHFHLINHTSFTRD